MTLINWSKKLQVREVTRNRQKSREKRAEKKFSASVGKTAFYIYREVLRKLEQKNWNMYIIGLWPKKIGLFCQNYILNVQGNALSEKFLLKISVRS